MEPKRILYVNGGIMSRGGIESYMMNYYRHFDKQKIQVDFIVHGFEKGIYDDEIKEMGGKIYNVPVKSKDYSGNIKALNKIFNSGEYKIVHSHMDAMSTVVLRQAKKCGIPIRIAHSHNTQHLTNSKLKYLLNEIARKNITKYATHFYACSELAGRWLYGEKCYKSGKVKIIKNAIDVKKYLFNSQLRENIRSDLSLNGKFVVGNIGRFDYQKNHNFLIDIFSEVYRKNKNSILLLVGIGHLEKEIKLKVKELGLDDAVIFMGSKDNVNEILNVFDVFVLPSLFEGFPVTMVEVQANSIKSIISDTITKETNLTNSIEYLSLFESPLFWAEKILEYQNDYDRIDMFNKIRDYGYDIVHQAKELESNYYNLINK